MENYIYIIVRMICAAYILYKVWERLFRDGFFGIWERIPVRKPKPAKRSAEPPAREKTREGKVVGTTNKVILDDPRRASPEPVATTQLEPTGYIGQDEPITGDDVEGDAGQAYIPTDEELYEDAPPPDDDEDFSSGVTFDELSEAGGVLKDGTTDEEVILKAAKTVYEVRDTEIFDFLANEVSKAMTVEELLSQGLDGDGLPLWRRASRIEEFDMSRFV